MPGFSKSSILSQSVAHGNTPKSEKKTSLVLNVRKAKSDQEGHGTRAPAMISVCSVLKVPLFRALRETQKERLPTSNGLVCLP